MMPLYKLFHSAKIKTILEKSGIETEFKLSRTTGKVQGISFRIGNVSFKVSEVDRKFSFGNLKKEFEKNTILQVIEKQDALPQKETIVKKKWGHKR